MIPRNEVERELLERIQKLESEVFNGETFETNYGEMSPREQAERISKGDDSNHHIGEKSFEVLLQEGFSLRNRYKPQTMNDESINRWNTEYVQWLAETKHLVSNGKFSNLSKQIEKMLHP